MLVLSSDVVREKSSDGSLLLHDTSYNGNFDAVELFVYVYSEGIPEKDIHGKTPLHRTGGNARNDSRSKYSYVDNFKLLVRVCPKFLMKTAEEGFSTLDDFKLLSGGVFLLCIAALVIIYVVIKSGKEMHKAIERVEIPFNDYPHHDD